MIAKRCSSLAIDDLPRADARWIAGAPRRLLAQQWLLDDRQSVAPRVIRPSRVGDRVDFHDRIVGPIHRHVEPDIEHVLVDVADDAWGNERSSAGRAVEHQARGIDDPGQLDNEFDGAIEIQMPIEPVLIVAHRRDERDHEPACPPNITVLGTEIGVFPQHAGVFLVEAGRVRNCLRSAVDSVHHGIEIVHGAQAIATERQAVRQHANPVLAAIEGVLARMHAAPRAGVPDAQVVQHEPFARRKADAEPPATPLDSPAIDSEAGTLRLDDFDGLEIRSPTLLEARCEIAFVARHWNDAEIVDPQHLAAIDVDKGAQPLDGVSILIVVRVVAYPRDRLDQAAADLIWMPEHATGPRIAAHQRHVGDASLGECREKIGMRLGNLLGQQEFVRGDARSRPWAWHAALDGSARQRYDRFEKVTRRDVVEGYEGASGRRPAHFKILVQDDSLEPHPRAEVVRGLDDRGRKGDLAGRQRIERMGRRPQCSVSYVHWLPHTVIATALKSTPKTRTTTGSSDAVRLAHRRRARRAAICSAGGTGVSLI